MCRVLLATIRDKGLYPCPRCYVPKEFLDQLGMPRDIGFRAPIRQVLIRTVQKVRGFIYRLIKPVGLLSVTVENHLKPFSGVPTEVCAAIRILSTRFCTNIVVSERFCPKIGQSFIAIYYACPRSNARV